MIYYALDLASLRADGLLGLAPNAPSDHPYDTLVTDMYNQNMIARNIFTLYLAKDDKQSKIWYGGFDHSYISSALQGLYQQEELNSMTNE